MFTLFFLYIILRVSTTLISAAFQDRQLLREGLKSSKGGEPLWWMYNIIKR